MGSGQYQIVSDVTVIFLKCALTSLSFQKLRMHAPVLDAGATKVQDAFGTCLDPSEYQYSDDWRKDEDFVWPKWLLMKYNNLCSSLGEKSCQ